MNAADRFPDTADKIMRFASFAGGGWLGTLSRLPNRVHGGSMIDREAIEKGFAGEPAQVQIEALRKDIEELREDNERMQEQMERFQQTRKTKTVSADQPG